MIYEISYTYKGELRKFDVEAASTEAARKLSRLEHNPTLKIVEVEREKPSKRAFHAPNPVDVPETFLNFLKANASSVHIRLHWGSLCDKEARALFQKMDINDETDAIRPLDNEQYGISGTVQFPEPPSFLLKEIHRLDLNIRPLDEGMLETHSASLALSLIKAGLKADKSARF